MAIYAEGKEHAMAIGYTKMSTAQVGAVGYSWVLWGTAGRASEATHAPRGCGAARPRAHCARRPARPATPQMRELSKGIGVDNLVRVGGAVGAVGRVDNMASGRAVHGHQVPGTGLGRVGAAGALRRMRRRAPAELPWLRGRSRA